MNAGGVRPAGHDDVAAGAHARYDSARGLARLGFGFLGGAVAWLVHLFVSYLLVGYACMFGVTFLIHMASALLLAVALAAGHVSRLTWQELGRSTDGEAEGVIGRSRWMSLVGMIAGVWFAVVIVAQWIPVLMMPPCR